jgi:hypothetical protein
MYLKTPPSYTQNQPQCPPLPLLHITTFYFPSPYLLNLPTIYLATSLPSPEGRADSGSEPSEQQTRYNNKCNASHCNPPKFLVFLFRCFRTLSARQLRSVCLLLCGDQMKTTVSWPCNMHGRIQSGQVVAQPAYWGPATGDFPSAKAMEREAYLSDPPNVDVKN